MAETITNDQDRRQFQLHVDGELAALIAYGSKGGMLALTHTETEDGYGGQGYATRLVEHVLDEAEANGTAVLPFCPFVQHYLETHPERVGVVPERYRETFGLVETAQ